MSGTTQNLKKLSPGAAGAIVGAALGLVIAILGLVENRGRSSLPGKVDANDGGRPGVLGGDIGATAASSAKDAQPEDSLTRRAFALGRVARSQFFLGKVDESIRTLNQIEDNGQRDIAIQWTINKLLQVDDTPSLDDIQRIWRISTEFKDNTLHAEYLARLAEMRAKLAQPNAEVAPTVAELLHEAETMAGSVPADRVDRRASFRWFWGLIVTGACGVAGFLATNLLGATLGELGKGLAVGLVDARKHLGSHLPDESATEATGRNASPPAHILNAEKPQGPKDTQVRLSAT